VHNIARIEQLRTAARQMLEEQERSLAAKPESHFRQMLLESTRHQVDDLTRQLIHGRERRALEVVEVRLTGPAAHFGTLPGHILGPLTEAFTDMLVQAGRFIRHGSRGTVAEIRNLFDVRLNRMASGSTRLFYTLRTTPDLFGKSLAEETLNRTFGVLSVQSADVVVQAARYGKPAVQGLTKFLRILEEAHLEAGVEWVSPTDFERTREGPAQRISHLKHALETIASEEPREIPFTGIMITESLRGKFEVETHAGRHYGGTVPPELLPDLVAVAVGDECQGVLPETLTKNTTTGAEKRTYELQRFAPLPRPAVRSSPQLRFSF